MTSGRDAMLKRIREAVAAGKSLGRYLDPAVAEYIKKIGLYKSGRSSAVASYQA